MLILLKSLATTQQVFNGKEELLKGSRQFKECHELVSSSMILRALWQKEFKKSTPHLSVATPFLCSFSYVPWCLFKKIKSSFISVHASIYVHRSMSVFLFLVALVDLIKISFLLQILLEFSFTIGLAYGVSVLQFWLAEGGIWLRKSWLRLKVYWNFLVFDFVRIRYLPLHFRMD